MPQASIDKLIVTNLAAFTEKYGAAGATKITAAVDKLITADLARGLKSKLVDLSSAATMSAIGTSVLSAADASDPKRNKKAIDAAFNSFDPRPSYLMLLGSCEVIPHVPLENQMADDDPDVPSDLPYASDNPYSTDPQDFIAPTRVVGRLPNVTADTDPQYLVGLLTTAAKYTARPATDYNDFLGISALVWQESTELSLDAIFGTHTGLKLSPTDGPQWTAAEAKRLSHFVNCHGGPADPDFYGQKGKTNFPVAHSAKWMANKLVPGTVMSAECCYGAELYDPALPTAQGQMGMCNTYLGAGCYAYFGSSNTAYGPPDANDQADLICQSFLLQVVTGASAGRACIQSRLDYVANKGGVLTPTDFKTLSQFNLMGDPSLTPVAPQPHSVVLAKTAAKGTKQADPAAAVARHSRQSRRAALVARAESTRAYRLVANGARPGGGKTSLFGKLKQLAATFGVTAPDQFVSFAVGRMQKPSGAKSLPSERAAAGQAPTAMHVILERLKSPASAPNLRLVRGVQAVEYKEGMDAKRIESR